jgi:Domain of unknown function (DUF4388)
MTPDETWIESLGAGERERLGLDPSERLLVLEVSPSHLSLARVGRGDEHPRRGQPALRAELSTLSLATLLEALHGAGRSGLLQYSHRNHSKWIYLNRGEVVFAASNQRVDRLGECLLRAGVISLDQLREAERRFTPPERFGKVLVEHGFLTPRELWNGVKYQVEEIVRSLFAMPAGTIWFWEGELQPDNVVRLSLETRRLVAEGIQRSEELRKFLSVLDDPCVRLARTGGFDGPLAGMERAIVETIQTERPFAGLCEALGLDREAAARSIQLLRLVGAVKLVRLTGAARGDGPERAGALDELRAQAAAGVKLIAELRGSLMAADRNASIDERLGRVLEDATERFPALLTGLRLGAGGALDPELLADRAGKLTGDRGATLTAALGELVAYLEFEIMNHPTLEDPETLLRGLAPLRQMLAA